MPIYKMKGSKDGAQKYRVRINWVDGTGKPRQIDRVAYGKNEAKLLEMKLLNEVKEETPAVRLTVDRLTQEYLKVKSSELRETSVTKSGQILRLHILPKVGTQQLSKLNRTVLLKWKQDIETLNISLRTKQGIYACFNALLNYAVQADYLPSNPLSKLGTFKASGEIRKQLEYYTAVEFNAFIGACRALAETTGVWDYYVFFNIAFYTGLRKGEIHALRWSDIEGNKIHVRRSIAQKLQGEDRETAPKNASSIRTIQMPIKLIKLLEDHKRVWAQFEGFDEAFRVCGGNKCLRDTSVDKHNRKCAELAEIKRIRIHDYRHSHASLLANAGINIQEIARRLGHSDTQMTWNTYSHLYPEEEERAVAVLDGL